MARPRPTPSRARPRPTPTRTTAITRLAPALAPRAPVPWHRDRTITTLTTEILTLQTTACNHLSDRLVEIGRRLHTARERLSHGDWLEWLAARVPFDATSAKNYMKLAEFAHADPSDYRRLRHLGPTKLYLVLTLPPARRRRLPLARPLPLPGNRRKTIETMTVTELASHLGDLALPPAPPVPIGKIVQAYKFRVAALEAATTELLARKHEVDPDVARTLHDELHTIAAKLESAFDL